MSNGTETVNGERTRAEVVAASDASFNNYRSFVPR